MRLRSAALLVAMAAALIAFGFIGVSMWWLIRELISAVLSVMWVLVSAGGR